MRKFYVYFRVVDAKFCYFVHKTMENNTFHAKSSEYESNFITAVTKLKIVIFFSTYNL